MQTRASASNAPTASAQNAVRRPTPTWGGIPRSTTAATGAISTSTEA